MTGGAYHQTTLRGIPIWNTKSVANSQTNPNKPCILPLALPLPLPLALLCPFPSFPLHIPGLVFPLLPLVLPSLSRPPSFLLCLVLPPGPVLARALTLALLFPLPALLVFLFLRLLVLLLLFLILLVLVLLSLVPLLPFFIGLFLVRSLQFLVLLVLGLLFFAFVPVLFALVFPPPPPLPLHPPLPLPLPLALVLALALLTFFFFFQFHRLPWMVPPLCPCGRHCRPGLLWCDLLPPACIHHHSTGESGIAGSARTTRVALL